MKLSVVIPTYNPDQKRLEQTLAGLKSQTLSWVQWELIIIDNNSSNQFRCRQDIIWHPLARIVVELRQGLTYARLRGFNESKGDIIVLVDDDNILHCDYLQQALDIFDRYPYLGAAGGKSLPLFETKPPEWLNAFYGNLALRDFGNDMIIAAWDHAYPAAAPIGAGMGIRRAALSAYIKKTASAKKSISDRTGTSLGSGGDNDIVLEMLKSGWQVGYFPQLKLQHIIPPQRMTVAYVARLAQETSKSWVQLLQSHGINPWGKISAQGAVLRKIKAWFIYKAWKNTRAYIRWREACGLFEGLANDDN